MPGHWCFSMMALTRLAVRTYVWGLKILIVSASTTRSDLRMLRVSSSSCLVSIWGIVTTSSHMFWSWGTLLGLVVVTAT